MQPLCKNWQTWFLVISGTLASTGCNRSFPSVGLQSSHRPALGAHSVTPAVVLFKRIYGIDLMYTTRVLPSWQEIKSVDPSNWRVDYNLANPRDYDRVASFASVLLTEVERYPKSFITGLGIGRIGLYCGLTSGGLVNPGVPDPYTGTLFYDYRLNSKHSESEVHDIHHEIFHYFAGVAKGDVLWSDPKWNSYNSAGFHYGEGGSTMRDPKASILDHPSPGFVDRYAESGQAEDMAELYACLFVPKERDLVNEWRRDDPILDKKYLRLVQILEPYGFVVPTGREL